MNDSRGRAKFAILVPFTNTNLEPDMQLLRPSGVSLHFARMGGYDRDEIPDETQMAGLGKSDIETPLHLLLGVEPDVVLYGCTSATLSIGPEFDRQLAAKIERATGAKTVTAAGALVHALKSLGADRIAFASPYVSAINDLAINFLAQNGIQTDKRGEVAASLGNYEQGNLSLQDVFDLGASADCETAQAIVLSCTDMRSVEIAQTLEDKLNKPVVTSNQAMVFQALQILGLEPSLSGFGALLRGTAT